MPRPKKSNRTDGRYEIKRTVGHHLGGEPIKKSFYGKNKAEAEAAYNDFINQRAPVVKSDVTLSEWAEQWLEIYKKPDVEETTFLTSYERPVRKKIIPYFDGMLLVDVNALKLKAFVNTLTNFSQSYIDKVINCLRGIFETAIDNDLLIRNPARNLSCKSKAEKPIKRAYDEQSVEALCASDHKYALYVCILLRMGLRCSELCGLRWEDIDFKEHKMRIRQALTTEQGVVHIGAPKSQTSARVLPIPDDLFARLLKNRQESGYIAMLNGHHITPDHFGDRQLEAFYNSMNVDKEKRLSPHELRHTCGTLLYEKTRDIYYTSKFLGHSDIGITSKIYVHSELSLNPKISIYS